MSRIEDDARQHDEEGGWDPEEGGLEHASENVLESWPMRLTLGMFSKKKPLFFR